MRVIRRSTSRATLALIIGALNFGGCSGEPADPISKQNGSRDSRSRAASVDGDESIPPGSSSSDLESDQRALDVVGQAILKHRERFRNASGRTGILAEEPIYSVAAEEVLIRHFFQDRRDGFFLDVGCAWPIRASNTYYLEKNLGWTGIGIDALSDFAEGWAKERPESTFVSYIVTDRSGGISKFYKSPGLGLSATDRDVASGRRFGSAMETIELEIPMITIDDLLEQEGIEKLDLVSMDIEGHEPKALAGFDIERFQPELLVIEGRNEKVVRYLERHGYEQILRYIDYDPLNRYFRRKTPSESD